MQAILSLRSMCLKKDRYLEIWPNIYQTVEYITRQRIKAEISDFGDRKKVDEQLRDLVIDKCISQALRGRLLEQDIELKLDKLCEIARALKQ